MNKPGSIASGSVRLWREHREEITLKAVFWLTVWVFYLTIQASLMIALEKSEEYSALDRILESALLFVAGAVPTLLCLLLARLWTVAPIRGGLLSLIVIYPLELIEAMTMFYLNGEAAIWEWPAEDVLMMLRGRFFSAWFYLGLLAGFAAIDFYLKFRRETLATARAAALAHQAEAAALRFQLNPHFLFNTLNSLSALILERRVEDAETMILRLSRFLRRTVDNRAESLVTVETEIDVMRDYFEVERVRFGAKLGYELEVAEEARRALMPGLLIQPLIENALRHAVALSTSPGLVRVEVRVREGQLEIIVRDTGPGFDEPKTAFDRPAGVGLRNVQQRLESLYGPAASIEADYPPGGGARVRIVLPLVLAQQGKR